MNRPQAHISELVMHARYADAIRSTDPTLAAVIDVVVDHCAGDWEGYGQDIMTDIVALRLCN